MSNIGICKMCGLTRELRNSHIIPEFMYAAIYDTQPNKRFYQIKEQGGVYRTRVMQKGVREVMLCGECEAKLSKYEKYADENLYGKNGWARVRIVNRVAFDDGKTFMYEVEGFDYKYMKLFLDSLLWRLLVSEVFETPDYGPEMMEKLRLSLVNETPLEELEFPCMIQPIMSEPGKTVGKFMVSPMEKVLAGRKILYVLIDGLIFNFYVEGEPPQDQINPFLTKSGELKLIGNLIQDLPELAEVIKERMDALS